MKIDWLRLENFKNLKNFEVDFSLETERQVVIGRNGMGKSNILESIAWIFRDLDLGKSLILSIRLNTGVVVTM